MLSPLANRTYASLFAGHVIGLIGNGVATVALALLAYNLAGNSASMVLGIALTIKMIAYIGVGTFGGAIAQFFPRKSLLIKLSILRALVLLALPFATEIWHIYLLIFLLSAAAAAFTPIFQATIPVILPDERDYTNALSLSRLAYDLEAMFSPLAAAALLGLTTFNGLFVTAGAAFLLSAMTIALAGTLPARAVKQAKALNAARLGMALYFRSSALRGMLALSLGVSAAGAMVIINTVVYVRDFLNRPETDVALAMAAFGTGSMIAAFALPRLFEHHAERPVLLAGGCLLPLGLCAGVFEPGFSALLAIWFVLGCASSLIQTPAGRLLRDASPPEMEPSLFSAHFVLTHTCWLVCYPLAGWLAIAGFPSAFALLALISFSAVAAALFLWKPQPKLARRPS